MTEAVSFVSHQIISSGVAEEMGIPVKEAMGLMEKSEFGIQSEKLKK